MAAIIYAIEITTQPGMLCMTTEKHRYMLRIPQMCVGSGTEATENKNCSIYVLIELPKYAFEAYHRRL